MLLAIDVGNSNIVLGGYSNGGLVFVARIATNTAWEADQYATEFGGIFRLYSVDANNINNVIIASVVPCLTPVICTAIGHFYKSAPHIFTLNDAKKITVAIENAAELGTDILASAVAVQKNYPLPAVIIDMGTATKITALDENANLLGVALCPGLYISLQALVGKTHTLRDIPLEPPKAAIGRNTPESMKSGVVLGTADMLDGMIDRFEREMGGLNTVIATGGAAGAIVPHCRHNILYHETLLLDGLNIAAEDRR